jgi:two-component system cell cycle sensor histidine kinase/response regulator CckA
MRAAGSDQSRSPGGPEPGDTLAALRHQLDEEQRHSKLVAAFFGDAAQVAADDRSVFQALAERATEAVGDSAVATLVTEDGEWLEAVGVFHPDPERQEQILAAIARRRLDGTIYGDVIRLGSVVFIPNFRPGAPGKNTTQMSEEQRQILSRSDVHSIIALPLLLNGRVAGVLAASRTTTPEPYTPADVAVLKALAARASIVLDNARVHRDLRASTDRFETIIAESPIATVVLDSSGMVQMWNRASEALLGWSADEVGGGPLPTNSDGSDPNASDALPDDGVVRGLETVLTARDGRAVPVSLYAAPLVEAGTTTGNVLRWVDLSERKRLESQLMQAQRLESVGLLVGGIAHDFNNILSAILGFASLIDEDTPESDPRSPQIKAIADAGERAAALVRQLLAFGRQQVLNPEVVDLGEVVRGIAPMLRRIIGEDVEVSLPAHAELWPVAADRGQIEQVIVNLAVNARDAMPLGGRLTMETSNVDLDDQYVDTHPEVTPGEHVMLAVSDTGTGIDPAVVERIFEPFFTTKDPGRGTGLGLSTVYGIVKQSGGHIWVYSEPERGTTFRLYFPRTATSAPDIQLPRVESLRVTGTEHILVAEDEPILRDLVETILGRHGYRVTLAEHANAALEVARREPIDLLISDVVMPGESGLELAKAVRAIQPGARILLMSGYTSAALEPHGLINGEILEKPFTPSRLAEAVREALDRPS